MGKLKIAHSLLLSIWRIFEFTVILYNTTNIPYEKFNGFVRIRKFFWVVEQKQICFELDVIGSAVERFQSSYSSLNMQFSSTQNI